MSQLFTPDPASRAPRPRRRWSAAGPGSSGRHRRASAPASPRPRRPRARRRRRCRRPMRETPTSRTCAPGLTMSAVMSPRDTGGGDDDVGTANVVGEVTGAGVAQGHGGVLGATGQQQTERTADGDATADHAHLGAVERRRRSAASSSTIPRGVQGSGASVMSTSRPRFIGCRPSASLAGSTSSRARWVSRCFGSGSWTMKPVQAGSSLRAAIRSSRNSWLMSAGWCAGSTRCRPGRSRGACPRRRTGCRGRHR